MYRDLMLQKSLGISLSLNPCFIGMYRDILILKQLLLYNIVSKNVNPYQTHLFHHLSRIFAKVRFFSIQRHDFLMFFLRKPLWHWLLVSVKSSWPLGEFVTIWRFSKTNTRRRRSRKSHAEPAEPAESSALALWISTSCLMPHPSPQTFSILNSAFLILHS